MMRRERIAEVGIDAGGRVFVRPAARRFEHVYRAAMEVHWDGALCRLSHPAPRDQSPVWWFVQIVAAVADEYGMCLDLTSETRWFNIPAGLQTAMAEALERK